MAAWYRWSGAPVPTGSAATVTLTLGDLMVTSIRGENFSFEEPTPGSDKATRAIFVIAAKEGHKAVMDLVLQNQAIYIELEQDGLALGDEEEYKFKFKIIERYNIT